MTTATECVAERSAPPAAERVRRQRHRARRGAHVQPKDGRRSAAGVACVRDADRARQKIAASLLPHPNNGLCFVGYCDPDSPGGQLLENRDEASFFFDALDYLAPLRASIDQYDLSGHADRDELLEYAEQSEARAIVLTHGDQNARDWFYRELKRRLPDTKILDPKPLEAYEI